MSEPGKIAMKHDKEDKKVTRFTEARLKVEPSEQLKKYVTNVVLEQDFNTFDQYLNVDLAHVVMLSEQGVIPKEDAARILVVLRDIKRRGVENFPRDPKFDSLIGQVEAYLFAKVGRDVGGRVHTGRSRIDMNMAIQMLYTRDKILDVADDLINLQKVALKLAGRYVDTVMPGYTHLQHAQPWTFGHYMLWFFYHLERSFQRLTSAYGRTNLNPLGGVALSGSSWPLDRKRTMELLGFDGLLVHSKDAGGFSPDFVLEAIADCSIIMWQLSLVFSDLYIWATYEFAMIEPDASYCGTSSIMPQKKNPYSIEAIISAAGLAIGWLPAAMGSLRMPSSTAAFWAYGGRRLYIFEIFKVTEEALKLSAGTLETMKVNVETMRVRSGAYWSTATELADTIARERNLAFRVAHQIVGRLVANAVARGIKPTEVTSTTVDEAAQEIIGKPLLLGDEIVRKALDPAYFIKNSVTTGSVNPKETKRMIDECEGSLQKETAWLMERRQKIEAAKVNLDRAVETITSSISEA